MNKIDIKTKSEQGITHCWHTKEDILKAIMPFLRKELKEAPMPYAEEFLDYLEYVYTLNKEI